MSAPQQISLQALEFGNTASADSRDRQWEWELRTGENRKQGDRRLIRKRVEYPTDSGHYHQLKHGPRVTKKEFEKMQALLTRKGKSSNLLPIAT